MLGFGSLITLGLLALMLAVLLFFRPQWVRSAAERVWALAWAVETGTKTYHVKRREAAKGGMDSPAGHPYPLKEETDQQYIASALQGMGCGHKRAESVARIVVSRNGAGVSMDDMLREAFQEVGVGNKVGGKVHA
jgi:hypothetical protein